MNLCIDVGNTTIGVGFFKEEKLLKRLIFTVDEKKTKDEYLSILYRTLKENNFATDDVKQIIFSSVVPSVNIHLLGALRECFHIEPMRIAPGIKTGLTVHVDNPNEIGNDLIAVMVGAKEKYHYPCLIADLGTASKVLLVDKTGAFTSCVIMPGLSLSANSLSNRAALLPEVSLAAPKTIMAKNTVDAMNAGITIGHAEMVNGVIARYEKELGYKCKHILTGGGAVYVKEIIGNDFIYDESLVLDGLNLIIKKNEGNR